MEIAFDKISIRLNGRYNCVLKGNILFRVQRSYGRRNPLTSNISNLGQDFAHLFIRYRDKKK